ncbi:hypothetical protein P9112_012095 [Eukaryota sp. TZLM1-RC]
MGQNFSLPADRSESLSRTRSSHDAVRAERVYIYGTGVSGRKREVPELVKHLDSQYISVSDISCSLDFVLFLSSSGNVYAYGRNDNTQLGIENINFASSPQKLPISEPIKDVACGLFHSACVSTDGNVWTFGMNTKGQCGVGSCSPFSLPTKINIGPRKATMVACGGDYTLVLTSSGELICFGDNKHGQCGMTSLGIYPKPSIVPLTLEDGEHITHIACGESTSLLATTFGRVFGFGSNHKSQLPGITDSIATPSHLEVFDKVRVAAVSISWYCGAVLLDCGSVRCWHWDKELCSEQLLEPDTVIGEDSVNQYSAVMISAMANSFLVITDENEVLEVSRKFPEQVRKFSFGEDEAFLKIRTGPAMTYVLSRIKGEEENKPVGCLKI